MYCVIDAPPSDAGAVQDTVASALPPVADTLVGAPGPPTGVTALEALDADPVPALLVAVTVNVYDVPFVKLVTVAEVPAVVAVTLPGEEVTVYCVIDAPPSDAGAVQETSASALPPVADTPVGTPGTVAGVTALEALDADPVPSLLVAVTVNV